MAGNRLALRVATPADAETVGAVILASYSALWRGWYPDELLERALPLMTRANPELLAGGRYFVAEEDGAVVGCGGWSREPPGGGPEIAGTAHLRHFAVLPERAGRGIGRAILGHCAAAAMEDGRARLECLSSLASETFYARLGFRSLGPATIALPWGGIAAVLMVRERA